MGRRFGGRVRGAVGGVGAVGVEGSVDRAVVGGGDYGGTEAITIGERGWLDGSGVSMMGVEVESDRSGIRQGKEETYRVSIVEVEIVGGGDLKRNHSH